MTYERRTHPDRLARARIAELIEKDIATGESPFADLTRGPRSTELGFEVKLGGISGVGLLALNVHARESGK